jgi:hypothetical protein
VKIVSGAASVDDSKVPLVPDCKAGQVIMRTADGWSCATPTGGLAFPDCAVGQVLSKSADGWICQTPATGSTLPDCADGQILAKANGVWSCQTPATGSMLVAGAGLTLQDNTISARFGGGSSDVAPGDHNHDSQYRRLSDHLVWSDMNAATIPSTEVWPGTIPYTSVTGVPADLNAIVNQLSGLQRKLYSGTQSDASQQKMSNQNLKVISTFTFNNVPAGNVFATMSLGYTIDSNQTTQCGLVLTSNNATFASVFTHGSQRGNGNWNFRTLSGTLLSYGGGNLTIQLQGWCDSSQVGVTFGINNDIRFARQLSIIGGL